MTDIIIPAHEAKNLADFLRRNGIGEHHPLIRLLDPPAPSLRGRPYVGLDRLLALLNGESMSDDVTIPHKAAKNIAALLRGGPGVADRCDWDAIADLLDPLPVSLRDEVAEALFNEWCGHRQFEHGTDEEEDHASHGCVLIHDDPRAVADAVLAVVRKRIEALPDQAFPSTDGSNNRSPGWLHRDDMLRLLGGETP